MPTLLFCSSSDAPGVWCDALRRQMPELEVRIWPNCGRGEEIDYALVWRPPGDLWRELPALRAIFSMGAGVDHLLGPELPSAVPLVRMVDPALTQGMVEYVLYQVLRHHRGMPRYERQQAAGEWRSHAQIPAAERRVGLLGLGELGGACARRLRDLGFAVAGHARRPKEIDGVEVYHGPEGLAPFLARTDILICLLPLTGETRGMLDYALFERLPPGAVLINVARGEHLVEDDLLIALGEGRLAHAVLDVFASEPLPAGHPFWRHPHVTVTPHVASLPDPASGVATIVEAIRRDLAGQPLEHAVDRARGY